MATDFSYGEEFAVLRRRLGISQTKLGTVLSPNKPICWRTISNWENSRTDIPHWAFMELERMNQELELG